MLEIWSGKVSSYYLLYLINYFSIDDRGYCSSSVCLLLSDTCTFNVLSLVNSTDYWTEWRIDHVFNSFAVNEFDFSCLSFFLL